MLLYKYQKKGRYSPMELYVIESVIKYEGRDFVGVTDSLDKAMAILKELVKDKDYDYIDWFEVSFAELNKAYALDDNTQLVLKLEVTK